MEELRTQSLSLNRLTAGTERERKWHQGLFVGNKPFCLLATNRAINLLSTDKGNAQVYSLTSPHLHCSTDMCAAENTDQQFKQI